MTKSRINELHMWARSRRGILGRTGEVLLGNVESGIEELYRLKDEGNVGAERALLCLQTRLEDAQGMSRADRRRLRSQKPALAA